MKKASIVNDHGIAQSERYSHSKNQDGKIQTDNQVFILIKNYVSRVSSYFPIGGYSVS